MSALLLGYLFKHAGGAVASLSLGRHASWTWLAASIAVYVLSSLVRTYRWHLLSPAAIPSFPVLYGVTTVHTLVNSLLPARLGEFAFPALMRSHGATPVSRSTTMFLVGRVLDVALLAFLLLLGSLLYFGEESAPLTLALTAAVVATGFAMLVKAAPLFGWVLRRCEVRFPGRARLLALGKNIETDLGAMTAGRALWKAAAASLVLILVRYVFYWSILRAVGVPLTFPGVVIGATLSESTYLLPIHGVAGLGTVEAGWVLGMSAVGIAMPQAFASGLFVHVWNLILATTIGCLSLPLLRYSRTHRVAADGSMAHREGTSRVVHLTP